MVVEMSKDTYARWAELFKALADENRLAIFDHIRTCCPGGCTVQKGKEAQSVSAIAGEFDLALSTVSYHLKELRRAGLVVCERRGQSMYCRTSDDAINRMVEFLRNK